MRLLTVRHVTVYRYSEPVEFGEHRMMFRPRESHDLRLLSTKLEILPRPSDFRWLHDVFDNSVAIATFDQPARELRSTARSPSNTSRPLYPTTRWRSEPTPIPFSIRMTNGPISLTRWRATIRATTSVRGQRASCPRQDRQPR